MAPYLERCVFDAPVGLILSVRGEARNAMTVSCFSEVAHHPASLWVSIERTTYTYSLITAAGQFSLAVLHEKQASLARACGSVSGRDRDKCAGLDLYEHNGGYLFLRDCLASSACRVSQAVDVGGHTLFIADIVSGDVNSRNSALRHLLLSDLKTE